MILLLRPRLFQIEYFWITNSTMDEKIHFILWFYIHLLMIFWSTQLNFCAREWFVAQILLLLFYINWNESMNGTMLILYVCLFYNFCKFVSIEFHQTIFNLFFPIFKLDDLSCHLLERNFVTCINFFALLFTSELRITKEPFARNALQRLSTTWKDTCIKVSVICACAFVIFIHSAFGIQTKSLRLWNAEKYDIKWYGLLNVCECRT